jgi:drug/metabolite transporter (DMT)-like permease
MNYRAGVAFALVGALFWSLSGVLVRLTESADAWQIVFWRALAMTLTMLVVLMVVHRGGVGRAMRAAGSDAVLAGAAMTGASVFFILSLEHVTVANALFMNGITPFISALVAGLWLKEPVGRATLAGMGLAAAGVVVMVGGAIGLGGGATGNLLAFGSALSFAMISIFLRRGRRADMTPMVLWSGIFSCAIAAAALAGGAVTGPAFAVSLRDLALCAAMGSVQLGLGTMSYARASRHVPAAALQILALSELVFSPLWVWLVVEEVPAPSTLLGGALIMAAAVIQALGGRAPRAEGAGSRQAATAGKTTSG